jgi:CheY-like chemotaxis protein
MPKLNGYEMATKALDVKKEAILIAMTAADFDTNIGTLKEFGISGLILKPIDFNRLATLYTEALRNKHGRLKPKA